MKVLIQTMGSAGDTHPFVGVGSAMRARGHEVLLFGNELFREVSERAGLRFVQIGNAGTYRRTIEDPDLWHPRKGLRVSVEEMVIGELRNSIASIEAHLDGTDVVVSSTLGFAARIVRELHDVPLVVAHLAPVVFRSSHRLPQSEDMLVSDGSPAWLKRWWWTLADFIGDRAVGPELNAVRAARGLTQPVHGVFNEWFHSPDRTLGLFPDWFGPPQPDWPETVRLTGFPLYDESEKNPIDSKLEEWLSAGDPPVVFTPGSANVHASRFFHTAVEVCERLGLRAVLASRYADAIPSGLPSSIRHEEFVPFGWLLPRSQALVSHGGIGTCAQALASGVAHLVTHMAFDQRDNGSRLEDLGTGIRLPMKRFRRRRAQQAVAALLNDPVASRAQALAPRVDRDTALDATCREIEAVAQGRP